MQTNIIDTQTIVFFEWFQRLDEVRPVFEKKDILAESEQKGIS